MLSDDTTPQPPPDAPPPRPARYCPRRRRVQTHHAYLLAVTGEYPSLKALAAACGMPLTTCYGHCISQGLPLSQSRPRRP